MDRNGIFFIGFSTRVNKYRFYFMQQRKQMVHPDIAVALKHVLGEGAAPKVIASGAGAIAQKIKEIAQENNIPIHKDQDLASILSKVDLNTEIPEELYEAVAKVLAFIYRIDGRVG
jgi:flagellar biosynthesis protein